MTEKGVCAVLLVMGALVFLPGVVAAVAIPFFVKYTSNLETSVLEETLASDRLNVETEYPVDYFEE